MMDSARWQRIEAICGAAHLLPPAGREEYLRTACGGDAPLDREVRTLLAQLDADPDFLEPAARHNSSPAAPDRIGPWRIVRRIGSGGMGEVYLAEPSSDPSGTRVAIKVLRRGLDSDEVLRRFALERQILATLRHPSIAALVGAEATDDGRPCFVLEYVPGIPITAFADLHQLDLAARIALVLSVADAVAYAHRALVIHRDIKPANILVTDSRDVKLLDFGISKVLGEAAGLGTMIDTVRSERLLTLDYAAPEQLSGNVITTGTDVHAVGVLLYELLTGLHPFHHDGDTPGQVERAIQHRVPDRPSAAVLSAPSSGPIAEADARARAAVRTKAGPDALSRRLRGDLDNIVLQALRKEAERRYASVDALAEDLRRYLHGRPVQARPDTLGYRTAKFVRRNAGSVLLATVALLALLATTGGALLESRRANRAVIALRAERDEAVAVRTFLMETFGATGTDDAVGEAESVRQMVDRQATRIDRQYADQPLLAARLHEVVAEAYDRLGLPAEAAAPARRALVLRTASQPDMHPDVAAAHNLLGWVLFQAGVRDSAEPHLRHGLAIRRGASAPDSAGISRSLNDLGVLLNATDRYAEAESVLSEALAMRRATGGDRQLGVGITANNLAAAYYYQKRTAEAAATQALALAALDATVGADHQRSVIALGNLAAFRLADGDAAGAERDYRALLERQSRLQGREHPVTMRVMTSLAAALLGRQDSTRGRALAEAERLVLEALSVQDRLPGQGLPQLAATLERLVAVRLARGDTLGAKPVARRAVATLTTLHGAQHAQVIRARERWCGAVGGC